MRRAFIFINVSLIVLLSTFLRASPPETPDVTAAQTISLTSGLPMAGVTQIIGSGVDFGGGLSSRPSVSGPINLHWKQYRSTTAGVMQHVFYQQYASTGTLEVPILGAYLALHFRAGELTSIMGAQFRSGIVANTLRFSALDAVTRARTAMSVRSDFSAERQERLTPIEALKRANRTRLLLMSLGDGLHFRLVYIVPVSSATDEPFEVTIDADDETVLHFSSLAESACPQPPGTIVSASGLGQRGISRALAASSPGHEPGFSFDGLSGNCFSSFNCSVLQETFDTTYECPTGAYTIFPVSNVGGLAKYQSSGAFRGDIAADALYFTRATWGALTSINPNYAFLGSSFPGDKNILVQYTGYFPDNAFYTAPAISGRVLADSVVITPVQNLPFTIAASLDSVAHEWGHLMEHYTAGWPADNGTGSQLQEGFADVVGHAIEKVVQPAGFGLEQSSDWDIDEDSGGGYLRSGSQNDGDSGHIWAGNLINNKWHFNANPSLDDGITESHNFGNLASVVFRLLAEGGTNSECNNHPTFCVPLPGMPQPTVPGIGVAKASRILVDVIMYYGVPHQTWDLVAVAAKVAAGDEYSSVDPPCAAAEQNSVIKAFAAVGLNAGSPSC